MNQEITEWDLRTKSGEILHRLDQGVSFVVTRNGTPVGELVPFKRTRFVPTEKLVAAFRNTPKIDRQQFFADIDAFVDQDPTPRA